MTYTVSGLVAETSAGPMPVYATTLPSALRPPGVQSVAPDLVASANPGCTLQMQSIFRERGVALRAAHPIELLDAAISGTPLG